MNDMSAYLLVRVNVTDWDKYKEYMKVTPGVIEKYGGRFMVRGGDVETLEGPPETYRVVLVEFPSFQRAKEFYHSEEYAAARGIRAGAADAQISVIDGVN
jgi:uncharacterized protein (DUF1330 family)